MVASLSILAPTSRRADAQSIDAVGSLAREKPGHSWPTRDDPTAVGPTGRGKDGMSQATTGRADDRVHPLPAAGTTVVLFVTTPAADESGPAALLPFGSSTPVRRLLDDLHALGVGEAIVVTRPQWTSAVAAMVAGDARVVPSASIVTDLSHIADVVADAGGSVVLGMADIVTHRAAVAGLLADPRVSTGVLSTGSRRRARWSFPITNSHGRLLSAASAYHAVSRRSAYFLDLVQVAARDLPALHEVALRLSGVLSAGVPPEWAAELRARRVRWEEAAIAASVAAAQGQQADGLPPGDRADGTTEASPDQVEDGGDGEVSFAADAEGDPGAFSDEAGSVAALLRTRTLAAENDVCALVLVGLVRAGVTLTNSYLRALFWARPLSALDAWTAYERMETYDEDKLVLASAVKASDGFFTTFLVSPYSRFIAGWCARRGFSPNQVTIVSMLLGIVAAVAMATGTRAGLVTGAVLLQLAFTADCVDGQLARYTRQFSSLGAWLDSVFDRCKEYAVFAGLALGSMRGFDDDVWLLAGAALLIQTIRHVADFSWAATTRRTVVAAAHAPLESVADGLGGIPLSQRPPVDPHAPVTEAALPPKPSLLTRYRRLDRARPIYWAKRIMQFPIGERFALVSITAAFWTPRVTFVAFLAISVFALTKGLAGRLLRSVRG
ncbi:MAG: hypothetical protein JWM93_2821 [Frankiales bacterium]|nr:hypothetical protein [Frankiales bacterium]